MANKQQTAVQMLVEHLEKIIGKSIIQPIQGSINLTLKLEREQTIEAYVRAKTDGMPYGLDYLNQIDLIKQEAEQYYNQTYSFPETTPDMRELTEQEADILEQTFNNYCKSKNNHSLPDEQPDSSISPTNWRNDEYSEEELDDDFEKTHGNSEAENCHCGAYKIVNGRWVHVSDCCC